MVNAVVARERVSICRNKRTVAMVWRILSCYKKKTNSYQFEIEVRIYKINKKRVFTGSTIFGIFVFKAFILMQEAVVKVNVQILIAISGVLALS